MSFRVSRSIENLIKRTKMEVVVLSITENEQKTDHMEESCPRLDIPIR